MMRRRWLPIVGLNVVNSLLAYAMPEIAYILGLLAAVGSTLIVEATQ